ncbi:MAG TPA: alpha-1,3-galactosidase, partial [Bacteroidales bacterium]|nr:alpha-1,3-galactosidase [Bacteroidales bacterium]
REDYADIKIHRDSHYKIENGNIIWYGEGWTSVTRILGQELNLETNDVRRLWDPLEGMQFEEIETGLVRAKGNHKMKLYHVYQLRETFRDYAAVFTRRSKNISWKNVNFRFLHGMGIVCQFSENLSFDLVAIAPDSTSGRTTAAWADCLHISGCRGKILVKDCTFKGAHDDAINIHGTYMRVVEKISDSELKLKFMHRQTYGFMAVNAGDEIEFVDQDSYSSVGMNKVLDAKLIGPKEMILKLEKSVPEELRLGDVIENVTWIPEVEIRGCMVSRIPTRGFLLSTRKKVVVEDNIFNNTHMSAILLAIDANKWYESGYVHDMTIMNNKFVKCAEPVILIEPGNSVMNNSVYRNIKIRNNEFLLRNELIVKAKSTKGLYINGNTVIAKEKLNDSVSIVTSDCTDVETGQNNYLYKSDQYD